MLSIPWILALATGLAAPAPQVPAPIAAGDGATAGAERASGAVGADTAGRNVRPGNATHLRIEVAPAETMAVTLAGEGSPVVIVPGMLGAAFGFRKVIPLLEAEGRRVVVIDPLGTGASSRPRHADYSFTAQADRVAAVLDSLGIGGAVAVCHALGASICYRLAYRHPGALAGIVSLNGGPAEQVGSPGLRFALRFGPLLRLFGGNDGARSKVREGLRHSSFDSTWVTEAVVDAYVAPFGGSAGGAIALLKRFASAHEPEPLAPHLPDVRVPVELLIGAAPRSATDDDVQLDVLRRGLPDLAVDTVAGAGQYIQEERPAAVARAVLRLTSRLASAGAR